MHEPQESLSPTEADDDSYETDSTEVDESESDDSDATSETDKAKKLVHAKKYLVFESKLYKLFTHCPKCSSPIRGRGSTSKVGGGGALTERGT